MKYYDTYAGLSALKLQAKKEYEQFLEKMHQVMLGEKRREFYNKGGEMNANPVPTPVEPRQITENDLMAAITAIAQNKKR